MYITAGLAKSQGASHGELNEAFAVQVIDCGDRPDISDDRLNVNGAAPPERETLYLNPGLNSVLGIPARVYQLDGIFLRMVTRLPSTAIYPPSAKSCMIRLTISREAPIRLARSCWVNF